MIQSTLSSMLIYFLSLFCMLRQVRLRLQKIQRDFLWGGGALVQKPHLVRWKSVCSERRKVGLGVSFNNEQSFSVQVELALYQ